MKPCLVIILCLLSILSLARAFAESVDAIIDKYIQAYQFSGAVLILKNGELEFARAYGLADDKSSEAVTLNTRFDIASIQKNLTAALIFQAIDAGLLRLDDRLEQFSLAFKDPTTKGITVKMLLEHQSGFGDIFTAEYREAPANFKSIQDKLALLADKPLLFEPGSERKYSNYGYLVLGAILEEVSKRDYWELLETNILAPSRDASIVRDLGAADIAATATPYHLSLEGKRSAIEAKRIEHKSPDGGGELSVYELLGFYHLLFEEQRLLSESSLAAFRLLQQDKSQWLAFGGGLGASTAVEIDFGSELWVIVLSNVDRLAAEEISFRVRDFYKNGEYEAVKVPAQLFAYRYYVKHGAAKFTEFFDKAYEQAGYQTFIGRTLTDVGRELVTAKKFNEAIFFFRYLTLKFEDAPEVYDSLAFGYFSAGKIQEAKAAFAKAKALRPSFNSQLNPSNYE